MSEATINTDDLRELLHSYAAHRRSTTSHKETELEKRLWKAVGDAEGWTPSDEYRVKRQGQLTWFIKPKHAA